MYDVNKSKELLDEINFENPHKIIELLKDGADPDYDPLESKNTPLILSIVKSNFKVLDLLLDYGANPLHIGLAGKNLLFMLVYKGVTPLVQKILDKNSNININERFNAGKNSFSYVEVAEMAENNQNEMVSLLNIYIEKQILNKPLEKKKFSLDGIGLKSKNNETNNEEPKLEEKQEPVKIKKKIKSGLSL